MIIWFEHGMVGIQESEILKVEYFPPPGIFRISFKNNQGYVELDDERDIRDYFSRYNVPFPGEVDESDRDSADS